MSDNMIEMNPYDRLMEPEIAPVQSPVIFTDIRNSEKNDKTVEMLPVSDDAVYSELNVKEYLDIYTDTIEVESDLVVPDIDPDMEMILNVNGCAENVSFSKDMSEPHITGDVKIETLYHSADSYGGSVCVIPSTVSFKQQLGGYESSSENIFLDCRVEKIDYRIINERKYKIKCILRICVRSVKESGYRIFDGIKNEPLELKTEKINVANYISTKRKNDQISEELLINDEKIRPVKIIKSEFIISENHRQITKEKIIVNNSIWVRILYMAELASKGNLTNHPVLYCGKIDHTQFIPLSKDEEGVHTCRMTCSTEKMHVEINREANGFTIDGEVMIELDLYKTSEKEIVQDFYHLKEDMMYDITENQICCDCSHAVNESILRETIDLDNSDSDERNVIYMDGRVTESEVVIDNGMVIVKGKVKLDVIMLDELDRIISARKICSFENNTDMKASETCKVTAGNVYIKEMAVDIAVNNQASVSAHVAAELNIYEMTGLKSITNPCIIRSAERVKTYPITIYTVKEQESVWDIAKKFKVAESGIIETNKPENIKPGRKIIIVK